MPGSVHSPLAKGCHSLIKQGAKLAESAEDILEELKLPGASRAQEALAQPAEPVAKRIFAELGFDPCDIDTLAEHAAARPLKHWPRSSRNGKSKA